MKIDVTNRIKLRVLGQKGTEKSMEDREIVSLFERRDERAITEARTKYSRYIRSISRGILHSDEDAEECENDTYLGAWNSIPPHSPADLRTYLGKLARRISIDRFRLETAEKRGGTEEALSLDELEECVPSSPGNPVEDAVLGADLSRILDRFLRTLPDNERRLFLRRYWYFESVKDLSERFGYSESKVKVTLFRTREKLKAALMKEEVYL